MYKQFREKKEYKLVIIPNTYFTRNTAVGVYLIFVLNMKY